MPAAPDVRSARRRIPSESAWGDVAWAWPAPRRRVGDLLVVPAGVSLLAMGIGLLVVLRGAPPPPDDTVVWIEEPPAVASSSPPDEPPPPPEPEVAPPLAAQPPAPETVQPVAEPAVDPAFGLDDAVATGGMEVATGSTLARAAEPVVRAPTPPAGPVLVEGPPASVRPVVPKYPPRAEQAGIEATVVALVTTDASGNVVDLRIERSGGRDFDESVRRAVLATRFVVPVRDGVGQAIAFRLPYRFRLD